MNAIFVLCGLGIVSLLAEITNIRKGLSLLIVAGLVVSAVLIMMEWGTSNGYFNDMLVFNNISIAFSSLIAVVSILWFWMSSDFFKEETYKTDRSALTVFAVLGAVLMVSFNNMAMLFLGIEILSISAYVLAGSQKTNVDSNEAAFKYFLMGSFATGFFLMGIALVYGATGSFDATKIAMFVQGGQPLPGFFFVGVLLMFAGMAFKMSAAPFHFWAPDVYEGSPTNITAFMSTVVKIGAVGAFFKMFAISFTNVYTTWSVPLQIVIVLTLVIANVTAVYQLSVKRMLAYSSVGHVGYILLAMLGGTAPVGAMVYYLAAYAIASITAFSVLMTTETQEGKNKFNGLFKQNPLLAVTMTIALLSLAGIPPLAGFLGKYMVFSSAIKNGYLGFVLLAVMTSLVGVYYYFRIITAMYFKDEAGGVFEVPLRNKLLFITLISLNIIIGLFPDPILALF